MEMNELKEKVQAYQWRIVYLNDAYKLYWHLKDLYRDHNAAVNFSPAFFQIVEHALIKEVVIDLFSLYDESGETSLRKLLNIAEQNSEKFRTVAYSDFIDSETDTFACREEMRIDVVKDIRSFREELLHVKDVVAKLKGQRDKYYAHLDKAYLMNSVALSNVFPLKKKDMDMLIEFASRVCNTLSSDLCGEVMNNHSINVFDIDEMIKLVERDVIES